MKRIVVLLALQCCFYAALAQLNFQFLPEVYGKTVDGLGTVQVQSFFSSSIAGRISMQITETSTHTLLLTGLTPVITLRPGISAIPRSEFLHTAFSFGNTPAAALASQTRQLSPGTYSFCFRFVPADKQGIDDYESCFDATIQPLVPINLIIPAYKDTICNKRPSFSWQPPLPYSPSTQFRLLLVQKTDAKNTNAESLLLNPPLLLMDHIGAPTVNFPPIQPELQEGKTYIWQVVAYDRGVILSTSEIWQFTVQCQEPAKPVPTDSYRELKSMVNGNFYIANRYLKFSFQNPYNVTELRYMILDVAKGSTAVPHLPQVPLQRGLNRIDLDLTDLGLVPGQNYILRVFPFNERETEVRFVYQDREDEL